MTSSKNYQNDRRSQHAQGWRLTITSIDGSGSSENYTCAGRPETPTSPYYRPTYILIKRRNLGSMDFSVMNWMLCNPGESRSSAVHPYKIHRGDWQWGLRRYVFSELHWHNLEFSCCIAILVIECLSRWIVIPYGGCYRDIKLHSHTGNYSCQSPFYGNHHELFSINSCKRRKH